MEKSTNFFKSIVFLFGEPKPGNYEAPPKRGEFSENEVDSVPVSLPKDAVGPFDQPFLYFRPLKGPADFVAQGDKSHSHLGEILLSEFHSNGLGGGGGVDAVVLCYHCKTKVSHRRRLSNIT